jgi:folate-binding protein YgfZ
VTNDVRALREGGDAAYCATLTPKGKIFADAFVRLAGSESDEFLLDVDREKSSEFLRALRMLSLRKRVTIEDANEHRVVVASADADVGDSSARAVRRDERLEQLGFRGIVPASDAAWRDAVADAHARTRIALGVAEGASELANALPLECNFDALNGVSFTKGCYVGQENTARQRFRGVVRKRIAPFVAIEPGARAPSVGDKIGNERGDVVGDVIAAIEDEDAVLGLVRARMSFIRAHVAGEPGSAFRIADGARVGVEPPSWWPTEWLDAAEE